MDRPVNEVGATRFTSFAGAGTSLPSPSGASGSLLLPPLREDIEITSTGINRSGVLMWTIYDPLQQRYFQIDHQTKELLCFWSEGLSVSGITQIANERLGISVDDHQVIELLEFVRASNLVEENRPGAWSAFAQRNAAVRQSLFSRFAHNYLFFKIPLVRPQRFLKATVRYLEPLYTWQAVSIVGIIGLIGLYLASRQWATFLNTFDAVLSFEGAVYFLFSIVLLKAAHELGHAFTASRFDCYVPNMGVAFMLLMPLLYTDVTDSWRISSRRQRLLISAAGIAVELGLACFATFLWVFLPEGTARGIAFMVATTGWVFSIAFNLNPCMKFDGYYLLSDLIGIDNLQPRAFALGRWKIRQTLFAPTLEPPELLSRQMRNSLVLYAWITWFYRLILFTTIAIFVYNFSFKLLGIVLFLIEVWYLIALPILREISAWRKLARRVVSLGRSMITAGVSLALVAALVVPWSARVEVPAVLEAADLVQIYPPRAARIISINASRGEFVDVTTPIFQLQDLEIDNEIAGTKIDIEITKLRLARIGADKIDREESIILRHELTSLQTRLAGLQKQKDELILHSPAPGFVLGFGTDIHPGRWIGRRDRLALIAAQEKHVIRGYVSESNLFRLSANTEGRFIPDDLTRSSIPVTLISVASAGTSSIDIPELASINGGQIAVQLDTQQNLVPITAQYHIKLEPKALTQPPQQTVRGVVELNGVPESILARVWRQVSNVLIRESGF